MKLKMNQSWVLILQSCFLSVSKQVKMFDLIASKATFPVLEFSDGLKGPDTDPRTGSAVCCGENNPLSVEIKTNTRAGAGAPPEVKRSQSSLTRLPDLPSCPGGPWMPRGPCTDTGRAFRGCSKAPRSSWGGTHSPEDQNLLPHLSDHSDQEDPTETRSTVSEQ